MILEMTVRELIANTERIETTKRHHVADQVQIVGGFVVQQLGETDLLFEGDTNTGHHPKIRAPIQIVETGGTRVTTADGTQLTILPISSTADDVQVTCDCEDFYFRFATLNSKANVLFGTITKVYIPKGTRNVAPASTVPAVCKHIIKLSHLLNNQGVLR